MSDYFLISAWYENADTEVHFEVANELGGQYFFKIGSVLIQNKLKGDNTDALSKFYYAEEDMLALAVTIIDEEMVELNGETKIDNLLFERYTQ
ncbi:hypothetical protein HF888_03675 [Bermanella marisrubri]|uniref:Uncharacterized protein n=1 Tax=Bermanella marisrubri TaxID=207949 RepID=Q1MYX5_9GAMM|nr:hypothetical protein [Bermanella marisrubri]EAT11166.1 hypothetical protein RED65_07774 [Oceanobacter sp. RED65] [Bermanella marisrubri]QIZ83383.1 hypothetical protein HF888_03675 [Bermanella marisrubri]